MSDLDPVLARLGTEQPRVELAELDTMEVDELVDLMCRDVRRVPDAVDDARVQLADAARGVVERLSQGGRLIYVGAGTAGRLGMLDAAETGPTFNVDEGQVIGVLAGGVDAFGVPVEGAEDDADAGDRALSALGVGETDCVVGISASGRTPFVLGALDAARRAGALTVGVACNRDTPIASASDLAVEMVVGPEFIAGSTRLNSGTVQKIALNVLSTVSMVRLGKTYGNLMVDLRPTNEKLRDRATRIVATIAACPPDVAREALVASGWRTKVAVVMVVGDVDVSTAVTRLEQCDGRLHDALSPRPAPGVSPRRGPTGRLGVRAALVDGRLVAGDVAVADGCVVAVGLSDPGEGIAIPELIDAQLNGYHGIDLLDTDVDGVLALGRFLRLEGVGSYQPTLITADPEQTLSAIAVIREAHRRGGDGARILGIHLEGPFLAPTRAGTHPVRHLREPDLALLDRLLDAGGVTMVTLAPERPGAEALIARCRERGAVVSLGHSAADASEAHHGFLAGATSVTHLYNAMEPLSARSPGLAGAALVHPGVAIQVIADGVHVADDMLTLAFASAPDRCSLVSDAIAAAGAGPEVSSLGEIAVSVLNGVARRADGTIAGSIASLASGLTRLARLGIATEDALRAATWRPARLLGVAERARLHPGTPADLVVVDDALTITRRLVGGRPADD